MYHQSNIEIGTDISYVSGKILGGKENEKENNDVNYDEPYAYRSYREWICHG